MDERPSEETNEQTGFDSLFSRIYRPGPLIALFLLLFFGLVALGYFLLTEEPPPPDVLIPEAAEQESSPVVRPYEEKTSSEMEDMVKQADLAIIETMRATHLNMNELDLVDVEIRRLNGRGYHYQILQIPSVPNRKEYLSILRKNLHKRVPKAILLDNGASEAAIEISSLQTHRLLLKASPVKLPKPQPKGPKLAVVIDDIGENFNVLKGLVNLNIPLTFAVWPHASHTRNSVELVVQKKRI